jgi:hypothetical protein
VDDRSRPYRRDIHLKSLYGITLDDFDRMLAEQGGRCAICGTTKPGSRGAMRVDHNPLTGYIRELLCDACNRGNGLFRHDPEILMAAARYLMKHQQEEERRRAVTPVNSWETLPAGE